MLTLFTIAQTALEVGIAKEVLRKWESRYGFPVPVRDGNGNRVYTHEQLARLKLIRRLLNDGFRPARVVPLDEPALTELTSGLAQKNLACQVLPSQSHEILDWIKMRDPAALRDRLRREIASEGLASFVLTQMPAMNVAVGRAWEDGEIAIRDEHVYSETVQVLLRESLASLARPEGTPRVLLTTVPDEAHMLGLLMLEVVMALQGACCISLGAQSPVGEIQSAASDFRADIVALSFSTAFPKKRILPLLKEIRAELPASVKLWAGGAGTMNLDKTPRGAILVPTLEAAMDLIRAWRL